MDGDRIGEYSTGASQGKYMGIRTKGSAAYVPRRARASPKRSESVCTRERSPHVYLKLYVSADASGRRFQAVCNRTQLNVLLERSTETLSLQGYKLTRECHHWSDEEYRSRAPRRSNAQQSERYVHRTHVPGPQLTVGVTVERSNRRRRASAHPVVLASGALAVLPCSCAALAKRPRGAAWARAWR